MCTSLGIRPMWSDFAVRMKKAWVLITRTYLYNFDPLKPHFYIVKLGFTGVYIIFLILLENIDCGHSLEPPRRGGSIEYPQSFFLGRNIKKYLNFCLKIFNFSMINFSVYLNRHVFLMLTTHWAHSKKLGGFSGWMSSLGAHPFC